MSERYEPPSDFLRACIADDVTLTGSAFADANLRRLIALTRDEDVANRDWAVMLLAQTEIDTPEVRAALLDRTSDRDGIVRAEALLGLAQRDRALALPLLLVALAQDDANVPLFETASAVADPALLPMLMPWWDERSDPPDHIDLALEAAIIACGGSPPG